MKTNKFIKVFTALIIFIAISVSLNSCKKTDADTPAPIGMGHLYFHLHTDMQTTEVDSMSASGTWQAGGFSDALGRQYYLTCAQFFVSSITIYNYATGTTYTLPVSAGMLKYIDNEDYFVADVPVGNYGSISFNIGLTASQNAEPPGVLFPSLNSSENGIPYPTDLPVYWGSAWNANTGYIYLSVSGYYYTNAIQTDSVAFSYQIGNTSSAPYHIQLPQQQFTILPDTFTFVHLICDYANLLQGISFAIPNATTYGPNAATADTIANRIATNFIIYEMATVKP